MKTAISRSTRAITSLVLSACLAAGCVSNREQAEGALLREDWDLAVEKFELALREESDPQAIESIKAQLSVAKENASTEHLAMARELSEVGDTESAYEHALLAFEFGPGPETTKTLAALRQDETTRLRNLGEVAFSAGDWLAARDSLSIAEEFAPTERGAKMLLEATNRLEAQKGLLVTKAREAITSHSWSEATAHLDAALALGPDEELSSLSEFARLMDSVDASLSRAAEGGWSEASIRLDLARALRHEIEVEYVRSRLDLLDHAEYSITLHGAVILPFKPQAKTPWDGPGGAMAEADAFIGQLGALAGPQNQVLTALAGSIAKVGSRATGAPDCYPTIQSGPMTLGGRTHVDKDDYQPQWNLAFHTAPVNGFAPQIVSFVIRDRDATDDDNVGSYQTTLGDLVSQQGVRDILLLPEDGMLQAGGILALKLSVQKLR